MSNNTIIKWFPGLDALRILAASLVVIMHTHLGMKQAGLPTLTEIPLLLKGFSAVSFFFVLSGFLITYLLLSEKTKTNSVDIPQFYWKRVFRIWPLYFIVIAVGCAFYWEIVPALGLDFEIEYSKPLAIFMYVFFAANFMNSIFHVGGMLHITWSIAVEEQFYLFWAPMMKKIQHQLGTIIILLIVIFLGLNIANTARLFELSEGMHQFIHTLQFHYMGFGAGAAYLLFHQREKLLNWVIFKNKAVQALLTVLLLSYYLFYDKSTLGEILTPVPLALLYAWLIINVSVNSRKIFSLDYAWLNKLGSVSYGVYMFHMIVVYAFGFVMQKMPIDFLGSAAYFIAYYFGVISISIGIAFISFRFIEQPILAKGKAFLENRKANQTQNSLLSNLAKDLV